MNAAYDAYEENGDKEALLAAQHDFDIVVSDFMAQTNTIDRSKYTAADNAYLKDLAVRIHDTLMRKVNTGVGVS